jgi:hypothetical protein
MYTQYTRWAEEKEIMHNLNEKEKSYYFQGVILCEYPVMSRDILSRIYNGVVYVHNTTTAVSYTRLV